MREDDVLFDEIEPMEATTSGVCCKPFGNLIAIWFLFSICC